MEKPVMDLPEPDSPTSPRTSPGFTSNDTPSTALTTPAFVKKCVRRSATVRVGIGAHFCSLGLSTSRN